MLEQVMVTGDCMFSSREKAGELTINEFIAFTNWKG
jgi:hypothetical protein